MRKDFVKIHVPCPCGSSSDAFCIREDESGYCFSCGKNFNNKGVKTDLADSEVEESFENVEIPGDITYNYVSDRGILRDTMEFYEVRTQLVNGVPFSRGYVYPDGDVQVKVLPKSFYWKGPRTSNLFGKDKFDPGSKKAVVVTEGADDALSAYQMLRGEVAVVSVISATSALKNVKEEREYLNSFDKIVLCLDSDKAGKEATRQITKAGLFDYDKLYRMEMLQHKDANDYLSNGDFYEFIQAWESAKRFTPDSIINSFAAIKEALEKENDREICKYPFSDLSDRLHGLHLSEFVLLKGLEGIGKTEVCRAIVHKILKETDLNIATIFLEEPEEVTIKGVATYELGLPCNVSDAGVSKAEIFEGYKRALGEDEGRLYIHRHFATEDDEELVDNIRFLVTVANCSVIFLDNLTMLTTGRADEDERLKIDRIIRRLRDLVNELHFCLVLVAHVNDDGKTRGSRLPDKLCNTVIFMERNIRSGVLSESNRIDFMIEKARIQGTRGGPAGSAFYDPISYRLLDMTEADLPPIM